MTVLGCDPKLQHYSERNSILTESKGGGTQKMLTPGQAESYPLTNQRLLYLFCNWRQTRHR